MRLKSIKLAGFKSFVDPTTVNFPANMCAVVGPNGCGKSNVIDAVRWVMGESSAKNLRGESMADVIFNGSVNRQPVGQAFIELVFDNSDGGVGGEYASYAEIAIKRQVTREGQSEYFLNGTRCRRRDITDIFLGTGLGPRSYAIIEQGMISRLIESKPEELRVFIEEAAGISKYKERRKETESRMRRTLENLERLTDLRDELERQLQHLQRQAQAAEKYTELKQEERSLKAQLLALQWRSLDAQIGECGRQISELEVKLESVHAEHQQVDTTIEQHRVDHAERSDVFNTVQATFYSLGSEVARLEQTIKHQSERSQQLSDDLAQTDASLAEAEEHVAKDAANLGNWREELEALAPELDELQQAESGSAEAQSAAEESMQNWQQQWDVFNQEAAEPRQQAEVQQSRLRHFESVLQRLQARSRALEEEQAALADDPQEAGFAASDEELAALAASMEASEARGEELVAEIAGARAAAESHREELDAARSSLHQLRGRQASLEALQQAALDAGEDAVSGWLEQRQLRDAPRLLERLQVEDGWQLAVETVLAADLKAICVSDIDSLAGGIEDLERGQLTLVDGAATADPADQTLASKVGNAGPATDLLAGIRVAPDLPSALLQRSGLAPHESVITPEGVWVGRHWLRLNRLAEEQGGAIRRQQELDELLTEIDRRVTELSRLESDYQQVQLRSNELEERRQQNQRDLQATTRTHAELGARISAHRARQEQLAARRERTAAELDETREQFQSEQQAMAEARLLLAEAIELMESDSQRREELLAVRDETRSELDAARQRARHDKDAAHRLAMRLQSLKAQVTSLDDAIARTRSQAEQLRVRREKLLAALGENDNPREALQAQLDERLAKRLAVERELADARQEVADCEHLLREAESQRSGIERRVESVRDELEQRRLTNQGLGVQREHIRTQLVESGEEIETVVAALPEEADEQEWRAALERVAARINRLGPINLAAIDEYSLQSERKQYLDAQNEDLTTALETLESAIRKIDKETRNRFRETFDKVNSGLQELFPRVFGGGSAYLEMTGEDLLDTGISIMARPPGKKNSTIHLLSGGEKALTAIALVFSIFQLNPAPFCMLDEVDAPLDDANVGRYARMVKEMSEKVQFIYITHNKISMELADQLMGVTMHEPGVSRLVSVDVDEAAELAAS